MVGLPSSLFEIGKPGEKREYFFIGLDGKEDFVCLDFGDRLTNHRCPLDGAYIISYDGDPHTVIECPACKKYGWDKEISSEKEIKKNIIPYAKSRIERLKEELNHLELILKLSENSENEIRIANLQDSTYHKANLSAKGPEQIIVDKSKAHKRYPIRETDFTKNSRLNH